MAYYVTEEGRRTTPSGVVRRNVWHVDESPRELNVRNGFGRGWWCLH
jgi:hypothetical protein